MWKPSAVDFVELQGFRDLDGRACSDRYSALMFQPRFLGPLILLGLLLQEWIFWAALGAVLLWSAAAPLLNPFRAIYNATLADRKAREPLPPAPPPRRFAQGMAGALMLIIATALALGWAVVAWIVEGFLVVAVAALIFGNFCLGSFLYLHLRGEGELARRILPWTTDD